MNEKKINARFTPKGDIEANWKKAVGFVPLDKEVIIYKPDENYSYSRIKVGDGVTGVNDLPFVTSQPDYLQNDPAAKDYIKNRPFYSEGEKTETVVDRDIMPLREEYFYSNAMFADGWLNTDYIVISNEGCIFNGGQYNLTIDDTTYLITLEDKTAIGMPENQFFAGNLSCAAAYGLPDTGEPYCVRLTVEEDRTEFVVMYETSERYHTIGVSYVGDTAPIIAEGTYTFANSGNGWVMHHSTFPDNWLSEDDVLNLTFNGEIYENLAWSVEGSVHYIGNPAITGGDIDTGEEYLILQSENTIAIVTSLPAGDYTFALEKVLPTTTVTTEIIHKIDPKFVPQADYLQNDPNGEGYIKNRPFYSEITYDRAIVPLQDMMFDSPGSDFPEGWTGIYLELNSVISIANGGEYELTIDETTYPITLKNRPDLGQPEYVFMAGNASVMPGFDMPDTKESYFIEIIPQYTNGFYFILLYKSTATTHKVGLSHVGNTVPLILEDEYDFTELSTDIGTLHMCPFPYGLYFMALQENDVFNVTFDDKSYTNLTWKVFDDGIPYLGNISILGVGDDTGEDWLFSMLGDNEVDFLTREAGPHTLSLEKASLPFTEIVHKIDSKYLDIKAEVPYIEDSDGNAIFKKDVQTSNGISLDSVGNRMIQINSQLTSMDTRINTLYNTQVDYNQNYSGAKDYIKNRPFYIEERSNNYTKTIYDSYNNNPYISYDTTNFIYTTTVQAPDSFVDDIVDGINIEIKQGVTPPDEYYYHYFNRTSKVFSDGNNKYAGNLYLFTKNRNDNTSEDYLFYYNRDTNQFSLYFLNTVRSEKDFSLLCYLNQLDKTYLKISIHSEDGVFCHQIDEKFLPDNKKLTDKKINTVTQDYVILTDIDSGLEYAIQIKNGNLVTSEMPSGIKITSLPNKINYTRGEVTELDLTGLVVSAIIGDTEKEITNYNYTKLKTPFLEAGEVEIIVIAELYKKIYSTSFTINVIEFNAETELIDFDYTENANGTYTLTGWKQTLNGKSSTELIVPNNSLIKI